jgi:nucleotidyltransferase substrate binding protein (TIGR01987 family)
MGLDKRLQLALEQFERALARLHEALAQPETEFMRDAVIQRFEFTFEAGWRAMYRWLRARGVDVDEDAYSSIPEAFKRRLIADERGWSEMRKYRNLTSHTYNEALAVDVVAFVRSRGAPLLDALRGRLKASAPADGREDGS